MNEEEAQALLNDWHYLYIGMSKVLPEFKGFTDLGDSTRGITYYHYKYIKNPYCPRYIYWGEIVINSRLKSNWRIKAVLWHEFCHHWAYSVYNYSGHQGTFDKCLRTDKKLWLLGSLGRIIPMF
jgi:hypothetical protein|nr:MAG TPA: hypothetical protein [Caudoviricetes sp.]